MNGAEELSTAIIHALPDAAVSIDAPAHESGHWWIDVIRKNRQATVEWRPKQGFGLGLGPGGYGEGPDVVVSTIDAAVQRVVDYLLSPSTNEDTAPAVLVASADFTWRTAVEEHLREHRVWTDAVATFDEAYEHALLRVYRVVVIDLAMQPPQAHWEDLRRVIAKDDSVVVAVATPDNTPQFDNSFAVVMHKRISTDYVASVIASLVSASATERLPDTRPESAQHFR